jgi:hypothetical protein
MSEASKNTRRAMREKITRLLRTDPKEKVDASGYTPPDALDADVKTGMRPITRRQYRRGGKVAGKKAAVRADRRKREVGGGVNGSVAQSEANLDWHKENEKRDGSKHVGGFKKGGRPKRGDGGLAKKVVSKEAQKVAESAMKMAAKRGTDPYDSAPAAGKAYGDLWKLKGGRPERATGGAAHGKGCSCAKCKGGSVKRAEGGRTAADVMNEQYDGDTAPEGGVDAGTPGGDRPGYSRVAVDKAIASSNRSGRKSGAREAASIPRLLRGRHANGGKASPPPPPNPKTPGDLEADSERQWGQIAEDEQEKNSDTAAPPPKRKGGSVTDGSLEGARPTGGRLARARGGRSKKATNINIIIGTGPKQAPAMPMPPPGMIPPGGPPGLHAGAPPPRGMPPGMPGAGGPPGMPPPGLGAPPPAMMGRRAGGRV